MSIVTSIAGILEGVFLNQVGSHIKTLRWVTKDIASRTQLYILRKTYDEDRDGEDNNLRLLFEPQ